MLCTCNYNMRNVFMRVCECACMCVLVDSRHKILKLVDNVFGITLVII